MLVFACNVWHNMGGEKVKHWQPEILYAAGKLDMVNCTYPFSDYRQVSNIRCTKSQNLNDSHILLKSYLANPLKPGVKSRMKM